MGMKLIAFVNRYKEMDLNIGMERIQTLLENIQIMVWAKWQKIRFRK